MHLTLLPLLCRRLAGGRFLAARSGSATARGGDLAFVAALFMRLAGTVWVAAAIAAAAGLVLTVW